MLRFSDINLKPGPRILRQFALTCLVVVGGGGLWRLAARGPNPANCVIAGLGLGVGLTGIIAPRFIRWIYAAAALLSFPIGWMASRVLLGFIYYFLIMPVALVMRMAGRDRLRLRPPADSEASLWIPREERSDPARYLQQY